MTNYRTTRAAGQAYAIAAQTEHEIRSDIDNNADDARYDDADLLRAMTDAGTKAATLWETVGGTPETWVEGPVFDLPHRVATHIREHNPTGPALVEFAINEFSDALIIDLRNTPAVGF